MHGDLTVPVLHSEERTVAQHAHYGPAGIVYLPGAAPVARSRELTVGQRHVNEVVLRDGEILRRVRVPVLLVLPRQPHPLRGEPAGPAVARAEDALEIPVHYGMNDEDVVAHADLGAVGRPQPRAKFSDQREVEGELPLARARRNRVGGCPAEHLDPFEQRLDAHPQSAGVIRLALIEGGKVKLERLVRQMQHRRPASARERSLHRVARLEARRLGTLLQLHRVHPHAPRRIRSGYEVDDRQIDKILGNEGEVQTLPGTRQRHRIAQRVGRLFPVHRPGPEGELEHDGRQIAARIRRQRVRLPRLDRHRGRSQMADRALPGRFEFDPGHVLTVRRAVLTLRLRESLGLLTRSRQLQRQRVLQIPPVGRDLLAKPKLETRVRQKILPHRIVSPFIHFSQRRKAREDINESCYMKTFAAFASLREKEQSDVDHHLRIDKVP